MATNLGTLMATVGVDTRPLKKGLREAERDTKTSTGKMLTHWKSMAAGIIATYAVFKTAKLIKETALLAARFETLGIVMNTVGQNAGYSEEEMNQYDLALRKTGISMIESRNSLARMAQAQLDLSKATRLGRIAQDAAVIGNINSSEAFQKMIYGIQTGNLIVLRTIGINVSFEESYKKLAKATGRTTISFTQSEKAAIRQHAVLEYGTRITGVYETAMMTAGKKLTSFSRYLDDFKVKMGMAFGPATVTLVDSMTAAMKQMQEEISDPQTQRALQSLSSQIARIGATVIELSPVMIRAIAYTFEQLNLTAIWFIDETMKGWIDIKYSFKTMAAGIGWVWEKMVSVLKDHFADFLVDVSYSLDMIPLFSDKATASMRKLAFEIKVNARENETFAATIMKVHAEKEKEFKVHGKIIDSMVLEVLGYKNTATAGIKSAEERKKAQERLAKEIARLAEDEAALIKKLAKSVGESVVTDTKKTTDEMVTVWKDKIVEINGVYTDIKEKIEVPVAVSVKDDQAVEALQTIQAVAETTSKAISKDITVSVIDNATSVLKNIQAEIEKVKSKTVTVTVNTEFTGEGSSMKPLSEKTKEMTAFMQGYASTVNNLDIIAKTNFMGKGAKDEEMFVSDAIYKVEDGWSGCAKSIEGTVPKATIDFSQAIEGVEGMMEILHRISHAKAIFETAGFLGAQVVGSNALAEEIQGMEELYGTMFEKLKGFQTGTDYVPRTGSYILHKGEIVIPPKESAEIRAGSQVANKKQITNNFAITFAPTVMTGDRAAMQQAAIVFRDELKALDHRWA